VPGEAPAAELVGGAVARDLPRRAVGEETVERLTVEGDLGFAVGAHDRAELRHQARRRGRAGRALCERQRDPDGGAAGGAADGAALLLGRAVEGEALRVDEDGADARDRLQRDGVARRRRLRVARTAVGAAARAPAGAEAGGRAGGQRDSGGVGRGPIHAPQYVQARRSDLVRPGARMGTNGH